MRSVRSSEAVHRYCPPGLQQASDSPRSWPASVRKSVPSDDFQSLAVSSADVLAIRSPVAGENLALLTARACPSRLCRSLKWGVPSAAASAAAAFWAALFLGGIAAAVSRAAAAAWRARWRACLARGALYGPVPSRRRQEYTGARFRFTRVRLRWICAARSLVGLKAAVSLAVWGAAAGTWGRV
jgi:hypothetical protein